MREKEITENQRKGKRPTIMTIQNDVINGDESLTESSTKPNGFGECGGKIVAYTESISGGRKKGRMSTVCFFSAFFKNERAKKNAREWMFFKLLSSVTFTKICIFQIIYERI